HTRQLAGLSPLIDPVETHAEYRRQLIGREEMLRLRLREAMRFEGGADGVQKNRSQPTDEARDRLVHRGGEGDPRRACRAREGDALAGTARGCTAVFPGCEGMDRGAEGR